jgi:protein-tyrosine phosphatase
VIDIHSHILFGLDDGSPDVGTSLDMLRMAGRHGTTDVVLSPHANLEYRWDEGRVEAHRAELEGANDTGVRVHRGCDFHLQFENIEDAVRNPRKYTIAGGPYLLVEFSDVLILRNTTQIFEELLGAGMIPVITHPERNVLLQQRLESLRGWVELGCYLQVTGQSILGEFGRRALQYSEKLMDEGLVHFVASDGHDLVRRPPVLDRAYEEIRRRWDEDTAEWLLRRNPGAAIGGKGIEGVSRGRKRGLFSFFRSM